MIPKKIVFSYRVRLWEWSWIPQRRNKMLLDTNVSITYAEEKST